MLRFYGATLLVLAKIKMFFVVASQIGSYIVQSLRGSLFGAIWSELGGIAVLFTSSCIVWKRQNAQIVNDSTPERPICVFNACRHNLNIPNPVKL